MFKMRPSLLPVVLLTTITLSSSNVLPILTINKLEAEPLLEDQNTRTDTLYKNKINPNIFYKVFIGTPKENMPKKTQMSRIKIYDNDNNQIKFLEDLDGDEDFNSEGFRKEQWHNYPRRLDRLNKNILYKNIENDILDKIEPETPDRDSRVDFNRNTRDGFLEGHDSGIIDGPLFIFKIRLSYLTDNINQANPDKYLNDHLRLYLDGNRDDEVLGEKKILNPNEITSIMKVKRKEKTTDFSQFTEKSNENKTIKKRIFSLWSRLQSLSHRGHELQHRRHLYAFYGLPEDGSSALTAETRATFLRPPGSPLSFWASSCSWRVRAALYFKGIVFEEKSVDILREQEQLSNEYRAINPSQKVPAIIIDGVTIVESMAIIQYLEDNYPERSLLPKTPLLRARMREICETVVSGIQPLQNIGLKKHFDSEKKYKEFSKYFTIRGLESLEDLLKSTEGRFCVGDQITMADLCLVPQVYNAIIRHDLNMKEYPTVENVYASLLKEKTFNETHPEKIKYRR